ncbi:MAG: FKBP-type peptidyl-prolyl cis-trans isomerase [Phocaeicola sp.]|nr:FKBP-type peptidyl-prolyl cis-trans isomerase [Phocaeicola sp.]
MNKNFIWLVIFFFALSAGFTSCAEDTEVADPYANWQERNEHYIDSIARVARNAPEGEKWEIYKNYKLDLSSSEGDLIDRNEFYEYDSVYVKVIKEGDGIIPLYTDTVSIAYQGFLINGSRFDGNYYGTFDPEVNDNYIKSVASGFKTGFTTALLYMKQGTFAEVYIPYQMAYGAEGSGSVIPGYSALKFEIYLNEVIHPTGPDDRSRTSEDSEDSMKVE